MRFLLVLTSAVVTAGVLTGCITWWLTDNVDSTTNDTTGGFAAPPSSQSPAPYISEAPADMGNTLTIPGGEMLTQAELQKIVDSAVATFGGTAAVAFSTGSTNVVAGDDTAYPAWSTVKIPIAIAAVRADPSHFGNASAAITGSNNDAAAALWQSLPAGAADAILSQADIPLTINTVKSRPEFSTFGQTPWSTSLQAKFAANL
ncbi:MAG: hypothetical protein SOW59_08335, partial [Corynebacterium sp.]|nr:hypothetical protein [Corynebacterium sp.]